MTKYDRWKQWPTWIRVGLMLAFLLPSAAILAWENMVEMWREIQREARTPPRADGGQGGN
ncbi:MAG: hypothetical protein ACREIS_14760 [Nitrospiraceae bacterium]